MEELCNNYLSYVKDLGFIIDITTNDDGTEMVVIYRGSLLEGHLFNLSDLEADVVTFLDLLKELGIDFHIGYEGLDNLFSVINDILDLRGKSLGILIIVCFI